MHDCHWPGDLTELSLHWDSTGTIPLPNLGRLRLEVYFGCAPATVWVVNLEPYMHVRMV